MRRTSLALLSIGLLTACGGDSRGDSGAFPVETGEGTGDGDPGDGDPTGDGDPGDGDPGDGDPGDGDPTGDGDPVKFDLEPVADGGAQGCGGGMGNSPEFSYIYISNTAQGTLTKLNTQTMVEEGRYITRPDQNGSPSRTSVNLSGDVAVANRNGGITKVYARVEDCQDQNGMPGIQTSANKDDILPWGTEECVAWYTAFPQYGSQRPVAWTAGDFNAGSCTCTNQKVWSSGRTAAQQVEVVRLDGDTGELEATVPIPGIDVGGFGAYGGVVDGDNGFWIMTYVSGFPLVHVDEDLNYEIFLAPQSLHPYGITIDHQGRIWIAGDIGGVGRFDPQTQQWDIINSVTGLGIQEHPDGYMWMGTWPTLGIQAIDVETMALGPNIPLPEAGIQSKGVSIDFYGYVWLVDMASSAFRIDPDTLQYDIYNQLNQPYTYSDMTGWGLSNVSNPQG
ncbi:MAG TPA: hypothetical protein VK034_25470 [Enhygromyxa sp.]|nr:hypothetical protein [Enhygromyxa sp.]